MNNDLIKNFIRILILTLVQIFVLKEIVLFGDWIKYIEIIIYPIGLMLLPLSIPRFFYWELHFLQDFG